MKKIVISRHAKSSWEDFTMSDIDRPLNKRGNRDAPIMAQYLFKTGFAPERIILSPSQRTKETMKYFQSVYQLDEDRVVLEKQLYLGMESDYIDAMYGIEDQVKSVLMLGHNPGITHIANLCSDQFISNVATSGILMIEMDIDNWVDASWDKARLKAYYYPKMVGLD